MPTGPGYLFILLSYFVQMVILSSNFGIQINTFPKGFTCQNIQEYKFDLKRMSPALFYMLHKL